MLSTDAGTTFQDFTYDFDDFGNLTAREDLRQGYIETFAYDDLNRVTTVNTLGGVLQTVTLAYGPAGTIQSKSDVGSYTYAETHPGTCGSGHAGPHAVTTAGGATYCYDANGNMTSGDGRAVIYSAFDKPVQIAKGLATTTFRYGPDRARFEKTEVGPGGTTVTTYIGGGLGVGPKDDTRGGRQGEKASRHARSRRAAVAQARRRRHQDLSFRGGRRPGSAQLSTAKRRARVRATCMTVTNLAR